MIADRDLPELGTYLRLESQLPFTVDPSYGQHVISNGNDLAPIHRWFRFKESFSANLLRVVIQSLTPSLGTSFRMLDPFCGVGTALLAAQELGASGYEIDSTGIERNPLAAFVARTKLRWPLIDTGRLIEAGDLALACIPRSRPRIPSLSSLTEGRCITTYMARRILGVRDALRLIEDEPLRDALLLGLAAAVEPVSRVRKDGRALRIVDRGRPSLAFALAERWAQIQSDASLFQELVPHARVPEVIAGDGRNPSIFGIEPGSCDLILTSPPYPNNIDYSEVYKLELWLLGFIKNNVEFLKLRKSTFRSHPTASFPEPSSEFKREIQKGKLRTLLGPLLCRSRRSKERWRERLLSGYFSDLWSALQEHYQCLRTGGYEVLVVGNSLHGRPGEAYLIPTDIAVATIAECIGFRTERILAARCLKRRLQGNHFLRESIVVLKKQ